MSWQPDGVVRAMVSFDASSGTPTIGQAFNATITDDGVGLFTLNFAVNLSGVDYGVQGSARHDSNSAASNSYPVLRRSASAARSASACVMGTIYNGTAAFEDAPEVNVWVVGRDA